MLWNRLSGVMPALVAGTVFIVLSPSSRAVEPSEPPAADTPAPLPANSPDQIKKAQIELARLDCFKGKGRIDGRLGDQTREAVKKYWASAKRPVAEVNITDEFIAELAEHGDNFCRPPRHFFVFGGRPGALPFFAPGVRPGPLPGPAVPPPSPAPQP
jgi:hypothetical protein